MTLYYWIALLEIFKFVHFLITYLQNAISELVCKHAFYSFIRRSIKKGFEGRLVRVVILFRNCALLNSHQYLLNRSDN